MQKKLIAAAVAGAFVAPGMAMAQNPSTVQIFGTIYGEYSWATVGPQGNGNAAGTVANGGLAGGFPTGSRTSVDQLQTPGSEVGFKGEEKLGGSLSAWFQCISTADFRGQSQNGWCGRNSAVGFKGAWGNLFAGNWDTPFKRTVDMGRVGGGDTGIYGTAFLFAGTSATLDGRATPTGWKRRQNNMFTYESPTWAGFQVLAAASVLSTANVIASGVTSAVPGSKPRLYSLGASYVNGPLAISAAYEQHENFWTGANAAGGAAAATTFGGSDYAWQLSAAYTFFGALKVGGSYIYTKNDTFNPNIAGAVAGNSNSEFKQQAWMLGADWAISGPHGIRGNWTGAGDSKGNMGGNAIAGNPCTATLIGNRVANCGAGGTGANLYQIQYYHKFSKRTEVAVGYVYLDQENNARYSLGGQVNGPAGGATQQAVAVSARHTF
jgi:predicted porin